MIRIEMKFLWFFPYHNTTTLHHHFSFENGRDMTRARFFFFFISLKNDAIGICPPLFKHGYSRALVLLCVMLQYMRRKIFWLSSQSAKSCNACKNEKWDLRAQLFPSWVSSSDLHQCHLPRLFFLLCPLKSHDLVQYWIWLLKEEETLKWAHFLSCQLSTPRTRHSD